MTNRIFFGNQAEPEDQAGFCDRSSSIHYVNESQEDAANQAALIEEEGGSSYFRNDDGIVDSLEASDDGRFNTTILEADSLGFEHPAKYGPGR